MSENDGYDYPGGDIWMAPDGGVVLFKAVVGDGDPVKLAAKEAEEVCEFLEEWVQKDLEERYPGGVPPAVAASRLYPLVEAGTGPYVIPDGVGAVKLWLDGALIHIKAHDSIYHENPEELFHQDVLWLVDVLRRLISLARGKRGEQGVDACTA